MEEDLFCQRGDMINGTLSMAPNSRNKRDLDIVITSTHHSQDDKPVTQTTKYNMHWFGHKSVHSTSVHEFSCEI